MSTERRVVYFHGVPGSPRELDLGDVDSFVGCSLYAPDRNVQRSDVGLLESFDRLTAAIRTRFARGPVEIIGFSLGAYVALEIAARLGPQVTRIDLISATAPLDSGDYLTRMAGGGVFRLAASSTRLFALLTEAQTLLAKHAPDLLTKALFATARGADVDLSRQRRFRETMKQALADCFGRDTADYRREILGYVA